MPEVELVIGQQEEETSEAVRQPTATAALLLHARRFSPPPPPPLPRPAQAEPEPAEVTPAETRRLVRLVGVEALKRRLRDGRDEVVGCGQLLDACVEAGAARTHAEAEELARALDHAGVVLLFRDKAYLHPEKGATRRLGRHSEEAGYHC